MQDFMSIVGIYSWDSLGFRESCKSKEIFIIAVFNGVFHGIFSGSDKHSDDCEHNDLVLSHPKSNI